MRGGGAEGRRRHQVGLVAAGFIALGFCEKRIWTCCSSEQRRLNAELMVSEGRGAAGLVMKGGAQQFSKERTLFVGNLRAVP